MIALVRRRLVPADLASRAAMLSLISNALLMALKIGVGLAFGSIALLGDGVDSAEDLLASALAFITVRLSLQPADEAHPYGHGKAESLAAVSQDAQRQRRHADELREDENRELGSGNREAHALPQSAAHRHRAHNGGQLRRASEHSRPDPLDIADTERTIAPIARRGGPIGSGYAAGVAVVQKERA